MPSAISPDDELDNSAKIVIIGAGLAGLAAGRCYRTGHNALILIRAAVQVGVRQHGGLRAFQSRGPVCDRPFRRL